MIQKNLRVTAQTVIAQMLEGHKTFLSMSFENVPKIFEHKP